MKRKKNKKQEKKKFITPLFVIFLFIISLSVVTYNIFKHDYFKISQIYINGNKILGDEKILSKLNNPVGENIFLYDEQKSVEKLKKEKLVKKVDIKKEYPDKIIVDIKEEYPYLSASFKDRNYIISNTSVVLDESENKNDLIALKGLKNIPKIGKKFTDNKDVLKLIEKLQEYKYSAKLKEIDLENYNDIGIIISDIQVKFGDLKSYDYKLKLLDSVIKDINDKKLKAYSIRLDKGKNPVVKVDKTSLDEEDDN